VLGALGVYERKKRPGGHDDLRSLVLAVLFRHA
jgi:hypothetical protein